MTTILITGANRGIGLEMCRQCKARGDTVIAVCRKRSSELDALDVEIIDSVDVRQIADLQALRHALDGRQIDILMHVAGILSKQTLGGIDAQAVGQIHLQFDTNAIAPLLVTQALMDLIPQGGKIGILTSRMGSIADNDSGGNYGYRMSKAAVNAAGKSLAVDLKPRGISVALLHPGFVRTDMTGHQGLIDADASVRGLLARIDALTLKESGSFWHQNGETLPW
ncbi:SDR family oxidoreductase [Oleiagrimonas sp.]|jgi:NAD(P)-dependent dehydrogenase (short-subunit alcohol dehydrogenase family)|uniref:SDR family oxidoreductase n=1 Tax=Oleiagrimonas sp. TaxID=2010330 RepID=UPI00261DDAB6|nr:SDR family oxidoreductase [Oleiagrimonas sp.]MDA3912962.1 SDR family oxidoreductase [Oleiagrimonas sp.]